MQTTIIHLNSSVIYKLIDEYPDVDCRGRYWQSEEFLSKIFFSEIIDIVLLYILKNPDYCLLEEIKTRDFAQALVPRPGPGDGYASDLEYYSMHCPGFSRFNRMNDFYNAQKGWKEYYKGKVISITLPKFKRHENNLQEIFNLAEMVINLSLPAVR